MQLIKIKENVECQRLLLSCKISSRSQWFPKRIFMNPGDVKVELLSPAISASMWFDWRGVSHNAFRLSGLWTFQRRSQSIISSHWIGI